MLHEARDRVRGDFHWCMQDTLRNLTGWQVLPVVVDISLLYGPADAVAVSLWQSDSYHVPDSGLSENISQTDVWLAWLLGTRLGAYPDDFWETPVPPSHPELPAPSAALYDGQLQVLNYANNFPLGSSLAFTFTLAGNMCGPDPHSMVMLFLHAMLSMLGLVLLPCTPANHEQAFLKVEMSNAHKHKSTCL